MVTTKLECQKRINKSNNVCDSCGRKIKPMKTVDNAGNKTYWSGCYHTDNPRSGAWGNFTWGVTKEIYILARKIILQDDLYLSMNKEEGIGFDYQFNAGVSKVCGILKTIEYLKNNKPRYTKTELRKNCEKHYKMK